ncbi:hypothetical protein Asi03nite_17730 [Actinoplanes siamensis]|uniref:Uncharacterized protein n=1 Tax=Actinoplanes siamensis TaxID=1223317 RepID=A0A919N4F7_9ACTN|nr:hypothetical protein Asi03nite_17730 [Actinoplanes siamensis]
MATAVSQLASALELGPVAEGIETAERRDPLRPGPVVPIGRRPAGWPHARSGRAGARSNRAPENFDETTPAAP